MPSAKRGAHRRTARDHLAPARAGQAPGPNSAPKARLLSHSRRSAVRPATCSSTGRRRTCSDRRARARCCRSPQPRARWPPGHRPAFFSDARSAGRPCGCSPSAPAHGCGVWQVGAAADRPRQHAAHLRLVLALVMPRRDRACGGARAARVAGRARAGAPADRRRRSGRAHAGPRPSHRGSRRGRARPPGGQLQHDARGARALAPGPAPARLRRLARAAHAADERPGEPRRARDRRAPARGRARPRRRRRAGAARAS